MTVLSDEDLEFWADNGYIIVRQAVSEAQAHCTADALWRHVGLDPEDSDGWDPDRLHSMMVEIYHHQTLWDNRQAPRVYEAFRQLWGHDALWVSLDRASLSLPSRDPSVKEPLLHWDIDLHRLPLEFALQGILYLTDTAEDQGAFMCVPGFHKEVEGWLAKLPWWARLRTRLTWRAIQRIDWPYRQDLETLGSRRIAARAGDLIIWHRALPHVASRNRSAKPRLGQYITMSPACADDEAMRTRRVAIWRDRLHGLGANAKGYEHDHAPVPELTPLGRKLLGLDAW